MLRTFGPHELIAPLLEHVGAHIGHQIDDVIVGNIVGPGGNIARLSALQAGLPLSVPGMTIDRQCSAGLEAIRMACYLIQGGAGRCYIAGGVESTSTSPYPNRARFSPDHLGDPDMGVAAEYVARDYHITREMQDEYALLSYKRSWDAYEQGVYAEEILRVYSLSTDEEFLRKRNMEKLVKRAKTVFIQDKGTVTAVNSCGIHDGACVVLVMEESTASRLGYDPILRFVDSEISGVHPHYPGIAPVPAIRQVLARNGLTMEDIDLIEINEAFASKIVACANELSIPYEKLNVRGGALAIGHPYGASGAMLLTHLFYEVQKRKDTKYVIAAIGSGGGIGIATLFEVVR